MQRKAQFWLDEYLPSPMPSISNFSDFEHWLYKTSLMLNLLEYPLSVWNKDRIWQLLQRLTNRINSEIFHLTEKTSINHIKIDFMFQDSPGIIKIIKDSVDGQIFLGKIHRWSLKISQLYIILFDLGEYFLFTHPALPTNIHIIRFSTQIKNLVSQEIGLPKRVVENNPTTGSWGFQVNHPLAECIKQYLNAYIQHHMLKSINSHPDPDVIRNLLQNFPIIPLLSSPDLQHYFPELKGEYERLIEWILSEFLLSLYPNSFVNQFRCDNYVFDIYWPNHLIIECKWFKTNSDWDRCIGQVWTYSRYQIPIILYIINEESNFFPSNAVFPSQCSLIIFKFKKS